MDIINKISYWSIKKFFLSRLILRRAYLILLLGGLIWTYSPLNCFGQSFSCDGSFYLSHTASSISSSTLLRLRLTEDEQTFSIDTVGIFEGRKIGALGYRVFDNLIYALDQESLELLRMNAKGEVEVLVDLTNKLDSTLEYHAGAISPFGNRFFLLARDPETNQDVRIFNVRLTREDYRVGTNFISNIQGVRISDIAFSPVYGILYGYDAINRKVVEISILNGNVFIQNFASTNNPGKLGALFFSKDRFLYGLGGSESGDNTIYRIDQLKGVFTPLSTIAGSSISDGCSCSYEIHFEKEIYPTKVLPCDTVRIVYRFENVTGTSDFNFIHLRDTLASELEIVDIVRKPKISKILEATQDNIVDIEIRDFLLGIDSAVIKAVIKEEKYISFESQATLDSFPIAIGNIILSDNPATPPFPDPTPLEVVPLEITLPEDAFFCPGASINVQAIPNVNSPISYEWNNGVSGPTQQISDPGEYTVSAMSDCQFVEASVQVSSAPPVKISLPQDTTITWGDTYTLRPIGILGNPSALTYSWESSNPDESFCTDCREAMVAPIGTTTYKLTVEDAFGCTDSEELLVNVREDRNIFIPNVFSPNLDELHDVFFVRGNESTEIRSFSVFNRWGEEVFHIKGGNINNPETGWDGTIGEEDAAEGVYFYRGLLRFPDKSEQKVQGPLTLLR